MEKQKRDRYEMHKYWGKKPSNNLSELIDKYSNEGDVLLDPFAGYGVFCCEAYIMKRNVISNDLNPIANFINNQLLEKCVDIELFESQWTKIKSQIKPYIDYWFSVNIQNNLFDERTNETAELITILRNNEDLPLKARFKIKGKRSEAEKLFSREEADEFLRFEKNEQIIDWYPDDDIIPNSRISSKKGMKLSDLFTKRTLACHARLFKLINQYSSGNELELFKLAFTANLANCSKLVPPINSRSDISQGAWMTGFYIGPTYIENNVLHYFQNRITKIIKGKKDYLKEFEHLNGSLINDIGQVDCVQSMTKNTFGYQTILGDAKNLKIESESIDYIFTDPPYGDAVPYFEQSIIWNSWLRFSPDYANEIVISDSKERAKGRAGFEKEIDVAFSEIVRVLKTNKFFSLTYHSLSGLEWKAITNACIRNGLELHDYQWLVQKSFTPRQINRDKSIKGDVLVTLKKTGQPIVRPSLSDGDIAQMFLNLLQEWLFIKPLDTNEIFMRMMKIIFKEKIIIENIDLLKILTKNFILIDDKWQPQIAELV